MLYEFQVIGYREDAPNNPRPGLSYQENIRNYLNEYPGTLILPNNYKTLSYILPIEYTDPEPDLLLPIYLHKQSYDTEHTYYGDLEPFEGDDNNFYFHAFRPDTSNEKAYTTVFDHDTYDDAEWKDYVITINNTSVEAKQRIYELANTAPKESDKGNIPCTEIDNYIYCVQRSNIIFTFGDYKYLLIASPVNLENSNWETFDIKSNNSIEEFIEILDIYTGVLP